jgi:hypothetical protein
MRLAKVDDFSEIIHEPLRDGLFGVTVARSASRRLRSRMWMISPKSSTSLLETAYSVLPWPEAPVEDGVAECG